MTTSTVWLWLSFGLIVLGLSACSDDFVALIKAKHATSEMRGEAADLLRSQLADALSERNEWREAFKQQRALPPPQPAGETPQGWWRWLALTTLLAIVVTAATVAATALAISFALAERPASFGEALVDTVDRGA